MRAGDGNRTRMTSLEGWGSTIELHPLAPTGGGCCSRVAGQAKLHMHHPAERAVAQLGSASALGAEGRRFKSCQPDPDMVSDQQRRGDNR
jgi:hypothetical protein